MSDQPNLRAAAWAFLTAWYEDANSGNDEACDAAVALVAAMMPDSTDNERADMIADLLDGQRPPEPQP